MAQPMQQQVPRQDASERQYRSARLVLRSGRVIELGRCSLVVEPLPNGTTIMTLLARASEKGREAGDRVVFLADVVESIDLELAQLQGPLS